VTPRHKKPGPSIRKTRGWKIGAYFEEETGAGAGAGAGAFGQQEAANIVTMAAAMASLVIFMTMGSIWWLAMIQKGRMPSRALNLAIPNRIASIDFRSVGAGSKLDFLPDQN
jgi:hypothetical protein